jgi:predicted ATPase/DNA-binding CsgD family transcriptional regulator
LASEDEQLALCKGCELWVDVEAFEEAAATARRSGDPAAYRAAIELYVGELLPADRYEDWAEGRREELRGTFLSLLIELAGLYEERGEFGSAVEALQRVVAQEPDREDAHASLMRLYALMGNKGEALAQYGRLEEVLSGELGTEPAASSRALKEEIAAGRFPHKDARSAGYPSEGTPHTSGRHNLPAPRTSFVERGREMVEVKRALAMTRLLTLTGAGGSGKTRLAMEVARDLVGVYPDGVWLVELAPLSEGGLVPQAVAAALGVQEQPGQPLAQTLAEALGHKEMLLLVLDNCEHLIDTVANLVDALLNSCPRLRILATSREALGVAGEARWPVPSLSVPDPRRAETVEELEGCESARLFAERASERHPGFSLTAGNAQGVAQICRRLEGVPLAIELAAARVDTLSIEQISERLKDSLKLLASGDRTAVPRQRTLKGALDWSHELLSEPERVLFRRLSVFAGGWTLETAEVVGSGEGVEEGEVLDLLSGLVEKSLIVAEGIGEGGKVRYRMLEPVRQYALKKLEGSGEVRAVRRRHAVFFLALAEEAEPELMGPNQRAWLGRLETEHDNLRAALSWSLANGESDLGLPLSGALGQFWSLRAHYDEGRRWLEAALAQGDTPSASARAKALFQAGDIAREQGDYERSVTFGEESLALYRRLGDKANSATALYTLGWAALSRNELERASRLAEEALALVRETNDRVGVVRTLLILGLVAISRHDYEEATALHEESLALAQEVEDDFAIGLSLLSGALASLGLGDHRQTRVLSEKSLKMFQQLGMPYLIASCLLAAASLAVAEDQPARAARLWGAAEALREEIGAGISPSERHISRPYIDATRTLLDAAAWEAAWAEGWAMSTQEAVEYALSEREATPSAPRGPERPHDDEPLAPLTRREEEVAVLLARGLTNRQIAKELSISEHTVENHVAPILKKLKVRSREHVVGVLTAQRRRTHPS